MEKHYEALNYSHGGADLIGQIALPAGTGRHPAVLAMHSALGMGEVPLRRIGELAALGYVGFASDMYGGGRAHGEMEGGQQMWALQSDPQLLRDRAVACFEALRAHPRVDPDRIAAIGYCFGGQCVLEIARSGADLKLGISYHGLLSTELPAQPGAIKGLVSVFNGTEDPYVPAEHVAAFEAEMKAAGARWQATMYSGVFHAFTDPKAGEMKIVPGVAYDPLADRLSWAATRILLEETIGS